MQENDPVSVTVLKTSPYQNLNDLIDAIRANPSIVLDQTISELAGEAQSDDPYAALRAITRLRFPDGVGEDRFSFYEKNAPRGTPDWVRRAPWPNT